MFLTRIFTRLKSIVNDVITKLDIKKIYDHVNFDVLLIVFEKNEIWFQVDKMD